MHLSSNANIESTFESVDFFPYIENIISAVIAARSNCIKFLIFKLLFIKINVILQWEFLSIALILMKFKMLNNALDALHRNFTFINIFTDWFIKHNVNDSFVVFIEISCLLFYNISRSNLIQDIFELHSFSFNVRILN